MSKPRPATGPAERREVDRRGRINRSLERMQATPAECARIGVKERRAAERRQDAAFELATGDSRR
jgi:hypothetical protein